MTGLRGEARQVGRFLTVAVAGLVIDLCVATALVLNGGFGDPAAATTGLLAGMVFNYFAHLSWTFRARSGRASVRHFVTYAAGVAVTLAVRIAFLWGLERLGLQDALHPVLRLGSAAAISFALSYWISSTFIFRQVAGDRL